MPLAIPKRHGSTFRPCSTQIYEVKTNSAVFSGFFELPFWRCARPPSVSEPQPALCCLAIRGPLGVVKGTQAGGVHISFLSSGLSVPLPRGSVYRAALCHVSSWNRFFAAPSARPRAARRALPGVCWAVPPAAAARAAECRLPQSQGESGAILGFGIPSLSRHEV